MAVDKATAELTAFEQHLEVHGSRAARWPADSRQRFEPLLAKEVRARELLAEAEALERLLDRAPLPSSARIQALSDRIAALAEDDAEARVPAPVVDLAAHRRAPPPAQGYRLKLASALAASLLVGIYIGTAPRVVSTVEAIASAVGLPADAESSDLVLFDDTAADDEDLI